MITCDAAVLRAIGEPLRIEPITVEAPHHGEVLVEMTATGLCGSDVHVLNGHYPVEPPAVCGHEGTGVVIAVGPGVDNLSEGDHVVQTFIGPCGWCRRCRRGRPTFCATGMHPSGLMRDGTHRMADAAGAPVGNYLGLGSFSKITATPARHLVAIGPDIPAEIAALVSCGVSTGVGAVVNVARVSPGDDVLVIGLGGVGAAAVLGAVLAGAARIIVSEVNAAKEAVARDLGATHFIDATTTDVAEAVAELTGGEGVDAAVMAPDRVRAEHYQTAVDSLGPGGTAVQVGGTSPDLDHIPVSPGSLLSQQKSVVGTTIGGPNPARDALRWLDLYRVGRLPIDKLITRRYPLDEINQGLDDLVAGRNIRGIIMM